MTDQVKNAKEPLPRTENDTLKRSFIVTNSEKKYWIIELK